MIFGYIFCIFSGGLLIVCSRLSGTRLHHFGRYCWQYFATLATQGGNLQEFSGFLQNCPLVFECRTYEEPPQGDVAKVAPQARPQATGHEWSFLQMVVCSRPFLAVSFFDDFWVPFFYMFRWFASSLFKARRHTFESLWEVLLTIFCDFCKSGW